MRAVRKKKKSVFKYETSIVVGLLFPLIYLHLLWFSVCFIIFGNKEYKYI